ncbi:uncharacterized protein Dana_GF19307 [Drosophila ananassae]|uniref:Uncharacterized protein n=1 Tax=Drosophila ananassae TaxID=7217 RepID=B3N1L8_DROAN|nr:uncharacterized protein Dana_GF19307 [Drosophila ananassae]
MGLQVSISRIVDNYLSDRVLLYDTSDGRREREVTKGGVPLWNTMYECLECQWLMEHPSMVKTMEVVEVEGQTNSAVEKLAAHKTETVLISSRKKVETAMVLIEGVAITSRRPLGAGHAALVPGTSGVRALSLMLLNIRGPRQERHKLITSVVSSKTLYAVPVWVEAPHTRAGSGED